MKMQDGLHSLTFEDPPEERTATVSNAGESCFVDPPGEMLDWNETEGCYEGDTDWPRFYPHSSGHFIWHEPGIMRSGTWI